MSAIVSIDLPDSDKAACMAIARPVVDAVLHRLVVDFPDQTCPACGLEHPLVFARTETDGPL